MSPGLVIRYALDDPGLIPEAGDVLCSCPHKF
jgi:hypothetical protein